MVADPKKQGNVAGRTFIDFFSYACSRMFCLSTIPRFVETRHEFSPQVTRIPFIIAADGQQHSSVVDGTKRASFGP